MGISIPAAPGDVPTLSACEIPVQSATVGAQGRECLPWVCCWCVACPLVCELEMEACGSGDTSTFPTAVWGSQGWMDVSSNGFVCILQSLGFLSPMNDTSDLEVAQKPPGQVIDALQVVGQSQTAPVILSDPLAVSSLWEVLLMDGPS